MQNQLSLIMLLNYSRISQYRVVIVCLPLDLVEGYLQHHLELER